MAMAKKKANLHNVDSNGALLSYRLCITDVPVCTMYMPCVHCVRPKTAACCQRCIVGARGLKVTETFCSEIEISISLPSQLHDL